MKQIALTVLCLAIGIVIGRWVFSHCSVPITVGVVALATFMVLQLQE